MGGEHGLRLRLVHPGQQHRPAAVLEQLADDAGALLGRLARAVDRFRQALAQPAVMVDAGIAEIGEGQPAQRPDGIVGGNAAVAHVLEQRSQRRFVHVVHPRSEPHGSRRLRMAADADPMGGRADPMAAAADRASP